MRKIILTVISFFMVGCSGGSNPDVEAANKIPESQSVGAQKVDIIDGDALSFNSGTISGTGVVRSATALSTTDSANNYAVKFLLNHSGSITFIANAKKDLSAGVELTFTRLASTSTLEVIARAGSDILDLSENFEDVDASAEISFLIDIHNDHEAESHLVFWDGSGGEMFEDLLRGKGFGSHWGLKLNNAQAYQVVVGPPKDEH